MSAATGGAATGGTGTYNFSSDPVKGFSEFVKADTTNERIKSIIAQMDTIGRKYYSLDAPPDSKIFNTPGTGYQSYGQPGVKQHEQIEGVVTRSPDDLNKIREAFSDASSGITYAKVPSHIGHSGLLDLTALQKGEIRILDPMDVFESGVIKGISVERRAVYVSERPSIIKIPHKNYTKFGLDDYKRARNQANSAAKVMSTSGIDGIKPTYKAEDFKDGIIGIFEFNIDGVKLNEEPIITVPYGGDNGGYNYSNARKLANSAAEVMSIPGIARTKPIYKAEDFKPGIIGIFEFNKDGVKLNEEPIATVSYSDNGKYDDVMKIAIAEAEKMTNNVRKFSTQTVSHKEYGIFGSKYVGVKTSNGIDGGSGAIVNTNGEKKINENGNYLIIDITGGDYDRRKRVPIYLRIRNRSKPTNRRNTTRKATTNRRNGGNNKNTRKITNWRNAYKSLPEVPLFRNKSSA